MEELGGGHQRLVESSTGRTSGPQIQQFDSVVSLSYPLLVLALQAAARLPAPRQQRLGHHLALLAASAAAMLGAVAGAALLLWVACAFVARLGPGATILVGTPLLSGRG